MSNWSPDTLLLGSFDDIIVWRKNPTDCAKLCKLRYHGLFAWTRPQFQDELSRFARCSSIWLTFVMHLWSRFSSVVWKIYWYFNILHSLFLCLRYWRCAEMSRRRVGGAELSHSVGHTVDPVTQWPNSMSGNWVGPVQFSSCAVNKPAS